MDPISLLSREPLVLGPQDLTRCQAHRGGRKSEKIDINCLDCKLQTKVKKRFLQMQLFGMLALRNFTASSILTSNIEPKNFRSTICRLAFLKIVRGSERE